MSPRAWRNIARSGDQVVVVVSAMSGVTDGLIKLAKDIVPLPSEREMDMLLATGEQQTIALTAIALHALGRAGGFADRRAGGHRHRRRPHQGQNSQHHAEESPRAAQRGQRRHRRRFSGRDARRPDHHAGPRRFGFDGHCAGRRAQGRSLPDLHGRGRRLYRRPAHRAGREEARRKFPTTKCSNWPASARR